VSLTWYSVYDVSIRYSIARKQSSRHFFHWRNWRIPTSVTTTVTQTSVQEHTSSCSVRFVPHNIPHCFNQITLVANASSVLCNNDLEHQHMLTTFQSNHMSTTPSVPPTTVALHWFTLAYCSRTAPVTCTIWTLVHLFTCYRTTRREEESLPTCMLVCRSSRVWE
jgi:hypothetical protein